MANFQLGACSHPASSVELVISSLLEEPNCNNYIGIVLFYYFTATTTRVI